ncbi:Vacuolar protein sorting-associated protein 27 [Komagataella phaffii CBS 7435]|uniref:Vacuolar protein sorting-associated protein 27 n=2 Tax=Komagataella phaffii TaxID=460519 RepID=C4QZA7_KOMPG|nr:Vacuolar protein sorting-associated protein 27 [Komagataella phaffii GS115]AOA61787.1 GQ67_01412T0 [Komagataella phaffii]CAH2447412.1 Vacuolar protein sorting-associated protein 27 [Komagataella phaffii CBS 7435]AOA65735.1 GQ68_01428T0 [Komagataella phaffii GS115]CAY68581.1 Vacuolar protein sorting-associated protein 27 [Komagataella phaffii GS115]CCA37643.1 Vacuolar protein sorting-associated protein 27 [Komagataella phaffii CBS 7435]
MSWFSGKNSVPLENKINEATSEFIPDGEIDLEVSLEITDIIRSKQVTPRDAMRALKRRFMGSNNPNIQKSSIKLIDFCIKNGGIHFVQEISTKEFLDPIVLKLHDKSLNSEVKALILDSIQNWSILFSTNPKLEYVTTIYNKLQDEKIFEFPSIYHTETIGASFIESEVAPEWMDSDACMICSDLFTMINRKHHCRSCGGVFCGQHSAKRCKLPKLGITLPVRVCDNCYDQHKSRKQRHKNSNSVTTAAAPSDADMDADLKLAIELSLKDSGGSQYPVPVAGPKVSSTVKVDDDDEEMKAAIEASLKDLKQSQPSNPHTQTEDETPNYYANLLPTASVDTTPISNQQPEVVTYRPANEIPISEEEKRFRQNEVTGGEVADIHLFSTLVERLREQPTGSVLQDQELQDLHSKVTLMRPKLNKSVADSVQKYDQFVDMYSKIDTITRLYDELLEIRLAHVTGRPLHPQSTGRSSIHYRQPGSRFSSIDHSSQHPLQDPTHHIQQPYYEPSNDSQHPPALALSSEPPGDLKYPSEPAQYQVSPPSRRQSYQSHSSYPAPPQLAKIDSGVPQHASNSVYPAPPLLARIDSTLSRDTSHSNYPPEQLPYPQPGYPSYQQNVPMYEGSPKDTRSPAEFSPEYSNIPESAETPLGYPQPPYEAHPEPYSPQYSYDKYDQREVQRHDSVRYNPAPSYPNSGYSYPRADQNQNQNQHQINAVNREQATTWPQVPQNSPPPVPTVEAKEPDAPLIEL